MYQVEKWTCWRVKDAGYECGLLLGVHSSEPIENKKWPAFALLFSLLLLGTHLEGSLPSQDSVIWSGKIYFSLSALLAGLIPLGML